MAAGGERAGRGRGGGSEEERRNLSVRASGGRNGFWAGVGVNFRERDHLTLPTERVSAVARNLTIGLYRTVMYCPRLYTGLWPNKSTACSVEKRRNFLFWRDY